MASRRAPAIAVCAPVAQNIVGRRAQGAIMFSAQHQFEALEEGTTRETATSPLRADAMLPLIEHGFGKTSVSG